jgi:polysaccharide export outer membrane protein
MQLFWIDLAFEQIISIKKLATTLIAGIILILMAGCSSVATSVMDTTGPVDPLQAGLLDEYQIGVGDSLKISVWRNPDLSAQVVVLPDGRISVPLVGDVNAVGETTESLAERVTEGLNTFVREPEVTVSVLSAVSAEYLQRVRITGAVVAPMSLAFRRGLTVLDVVLLAGGLTPFANGDKALLYRTEGKELKVYPVRLQDILAKGKLETNYNVLPSDIITVPEKRF